MEKLKVYEYDLNHKLVNVYDSQRDCVEIHYSHRKHKKTTTFLVLEKFGIKYNVSKFNGNYLFNQKIDKNTFRQIKNITESVYCSKRIKDNLDLIQIFNLEGDLLIEVRNLNVLKNLIKIPLQTVRNQIENNGKNLKKEFIIKYKNK